MRYISTRGQAPPVSFLDAVLAGIAPDGGLYVPESWPALTNGLVAGHRASQDVATGYVANSGYGFAAGAALATLSGEAYSAIEAWELARNVYHHSDGWPPCVTPWLKNQFRQLAARAFFISPSLSFKDVAMQFIAPPMTAPLQREGSG